MPPKKLNCSEAHSGRDPGPCMCSLSAGKAILCLTCYKNFNKFVRSDDSLNELSKTDDYQLTKCFHSLIRWNIAM